MSAIEGNVIAASELEQENESKEEHEAKGKQETVDATPEVSEAVLREYKYLKTGQFTPEMFNVCIRNVPKKVTFEDFKSCVITALGFEPKKIKYHIHNSYAFLGLTDEEEREKAINIMDGLAFKSRKLACEKADPLKDPFIKKMKRRQNFHEQQSKRQKLSDDEDPEEKIVVAVCPYASKTYEEQLSLKEEEIRSCFRKLTDNLKGVAIIKKDGLCLELLPIVQSPVLNNYRSKVEFAIGRGKDESDNVVGFSLASNGEGSFIIVEPTKCVNISLKAIQIGKEFQQFIQDLSYPSYDYSTHVGFWQRLIIRITTDNDIMVIIQVNPSHLSTEDFDCVQQKISDFFTSAGDTKVSSLYMSSSSQKTVLVDTFNHLAGELSISEKVVGLQFRISPYSFFQVNMSAAETLYKTICEWCHTEEDDTHILDIFCGVGTMGICIANGTSHRVTGIELKEQALEDAKFNADSNGIQNSNFICGKAEDVIVDTMHNIISNGNTTNIIAVIDPPRTGLRRCVAETLRACSAVKRVIYVTCNPKQASDNFLWFCRPESKRLSGLPFQPARALPIDLSPHTRHCEVIMELVRT